MSDKQEEFEKWYSEWSDAIEVDDLDNKNLYRASFFKAWNIQQARIDKLEKALEEVRSDLKAMLARLGVVDSKGKIVNLTAQEIGRYINNITKALPKNK